MISPADVADGPESSAVPNSSPLGHSPVVAGTLESRYAFHTDADLTATVGMIAGGVPAVVTALVAHGGISGWLGDPWHGGSSGEKHTEGVGGAEKYHQRRALRGRYRRARMTVLNGRPALTGVAASHPSAEFRPQSRFVGWMPDRIERR